jgi:hypothetical protein
MATKKLPPGFKPFGAKESMKEEKSEKRMSKAAYAAGEKKEGLHGKPKKK